MPKIYLSPSTQEFNKFVTGGSEEYYMNLLADYLVPYLYANGIRFNRNDKSMTAAENIRASNAGDYDFHLSLHSNAAPKGEEGLRRGVEIYYFPYSLGGKKMAELIQDNMEEIYPDPENIKLVPTTSLGEVDRTKAPSVLLETAYHDNIFDARWIEENLADIAKALGISLAEYFNIPFAEPQMPIEATAATGYGNLNLRNLPNTHSEILAVIPKGAAVTVFGYQDGWARVTYNDILGFVANQYLKYN